MLKHFKVSCFGKTSGGGGGGGGGAVVGRIRNVSSQCSLIL